MPSVRALLIPKGAKNVEVAKELLKVLGAAAGHQRAARSRAWPQYSEHAGDREERPWWFDDPHRAAYATQGLVEPDSAAILGLQSGLCARSRTSTVWSQGWLDIIQNGMTPQAAAEKAFKRVEEIFAKYPIAQS